MHKVNLLLQIALGFDHFVRSCFKLYVCEVMKLK